MSKSGAVLESARREDSKTALKVKFDQDLAEKIKVKDNRSSSKKCLRLDFVFDLD